LKSQTLFKQIASLNEIENIAKEVIKSLPSNAIILLEGDLAAGKTTFVSSLAKTLGIKDVSSPTFSLQQVYGDKIFHYDFYRLDFNEIVELGLLDEFEKSGWHFVEWAREELEELLIDAGFNLFKLEILNLGQSREYILKEIKS